MSGVRSTVGFRRLLPGLLAVTLLPAAAFAALVVAASGAGAATPAAAVWRYTSPPVSPTTPGVTPGTSPFPPSAPTGLTVTAVTTTSVTLSWTASTRGCCEIVGYDIMYFRAWYDVGNVHQVGNVTTATVTTGILPTKQYTFTVTARDSMGRRSTSSNQVVVVTPNTDTGPDTTPPGMPPGFNLVSQTASTAQLAWSPATDNVGVTGYDVYKFDGVFISTLLATVTGTTHEVRLGPGRNQFYVRARDAAGNLSIATSAVNVLAPTNLPTTNPTETTNPPVTTSPPVTGECQVTYTNTTQWRGGFVSSVTIRNTSASTAVDGWTLTFAFAGDQRVTSAWNTRATQAGAVVTARDAEWNRTIPAGGSVTFGMYGAWSASNAAPTAFTLNGADCVTGP
jgi:endoglucanase/cellulose 1,4-beta-cellobiosidase